MNKIGHPTYLSNYRESLIFPADDIECGNGPPLESNYLLDKLQHSINSVNLWCGDN